MRSGTRRMWSRRFLRAGWALAPVLEFPKNAWGMVRRNYGFVLFLIFMASLIGMFLSFIIRSNHSTDPATAADFAEARKDPCVRANLPQLINQRRIIYNFHLDNLRTQCKQAEILQQQQMELAKDK